jgi:electron transfer flavoprotein alpha subunit
MSSTQSWVVVADGPAVQGLIDTARALAPEVVAVVVGPRAVADTVATAVDSVVWLGAPDQVPVEAYAAAVAAVVAAAAPVAVVGTTTPAGRALLGAVGARLGSPVLSGISAAQLEDGSVQVTRAVLGGIAEHRTAVTGGTAVLAVDAGALPAAGAPGVVEPVVADLPGGATVLERRTKERADVDLGAARAVVAIGRGLKAQADLALVADLAAALGAEVACSRPLAEGVDWLPKDRYVGISGQHVAPDLYVAIGISGQLQHMVGVRGAGTIVAINSDRAAPVFGQCDFGIVGDLYQVVPELTAALKAGS